MRAEPHIIPFPTPTHALSDARAWGLALAAPYLQKFDETPLELLGHGDATDGAKKMLKSSWDITDRDTLLARLHQLATVGHRASFAAEGAKLDAMNDGDFEDFLFKHSETADKLRAARASYQKWKDRSGLAFDLCRYVDIVDNGFCANYLTEAEAWDLIMPMAKKAQESFSSWAELGNDFLDGREVWNGSRDPSFDEVVGLLKNDRDPNSPWSRPWSTELGVSVDTDTSLSE